MTFKNNKRKQRPAEGLSEDNRLSLEDDAEATAKRLKAQLDQQLLDASRAGNMTRVLSALSSGADVNFKACGWTPLLYASFYGHGQVMRALIDRGAAVNDTNLSGMTCLAKAIERKDVETVRLLFSRGAKADIVEPTSGDTPLIKAAKEGSVEMVRLLVSEGHASVNHANGDGSTALHEAAFKGHDGVVEVLLESPNIARDKANSMGRTPLHRAAYAGKLDATKALVDAGAQLDKQDNSGYTALHWAAFFGYEPVAEFLVQAGASMLIADRAGKVPEQLAAFKKFTKLASFLKTQRGDTPLPAGPAPNLTSPSPLRSPFHPSFSVPTTPSSAVTTPSPVPSPVASSTPSAVDSDTAPVLNYDNYYNDSVYDEYDGYGYE